MQQKHKLLKHRFQFITLLLTFLSFLSCLIGQNLVTFACESKTHKLYKVKQIAPETISTLETAKDYLERGNQFYQQKNFQAAIADYNQAIRLSPNLAEAYYQRGLVHSSQENYQYAFDDFSRAIQLQPNFAEAYYHRSWTHGIPNGGNSENLPTNMITFDGMISDLNFALRLKPDLPNAIFFLAGAYAGVASLHAKQGNRLEAMTNYQKALDLYMQINSVHWQQSVQRSIEELQQKIRP